MIAPTVSRIAQFIAKSEAFTGIVSANRQPLQSHLRTDQSHLMTVTRPFENRAKPFDDRYNAI